MVKKFGLLIILSVIKVVVILLGRMSENTIKLFNYDREVRIRLIGGYRSGKTTYYTMLLKEIQEKLAAQMLVAPFDRNSYEKWEEDYDSIQNGLEVCTTQVGHLKPQRWLLTSRKKRCINKSRKQYLINFMDRASELFMLNNYTEDTINSSDYIFLFVSITGLIKHYDDEVDMITKMSCYIHKAMNLPITKKIHNPVAVIFTKMDLCVDEMDKGLEMSLLTNPIDYNRFYTYDYLADSEKIAEWLICNKKEEFLTVLELHFNDFLLFCSASLLKKSEVEFDVKPQGVLNPFLWMLGREKFR